MAPVWYMVCSWYVLRAKLRIHTKGPWFTHALGTHPRGFPWAPSMSPYLLCGGLAAPVVLAAHNAAIMGLSILGDSFKQARAYAGTHVCKHVCMYVCMHACMYMYVCLYVCMSACMHARMYAFMHAYTSLDACMCTCVDACLSKVM